MKNRIEIIGIDSTEFSQIFQSDKLPEIGLEIELQDGVRIINLTSPTPNLIDSNIFVILIETTVEIATTILVGLITNYIYDGLKNKKSKKIISKEMPTKIQLDIKDCTDDEQT